MCTCERMKTCSQSSLGSNVIWRTDRHFQPSLIFCTFVLSITETMAALRAQVQPRPGLQLLLQRKCAGFSCFTDFWLTGNCTSAKEKKGKGDHNLQMWIHHRCHMMWISALPRSAFGCAAGPHHTPSAAAGPGAALRRLCRQPWISMGSGTSGARTVPSWITLWGRSAPCGTGARSEEAAIGPCRAWALWPGCTRWVR